MKKKQKLTRAERLEIGILMEKHYSFRTIGRALGRSPNTIAMEVKRNASYQPLKADAKASVRKRMGKFQWRKVRQNQALEEYIVEKLNIHWNPDEISGSMPRGKLPFYTSKTAIYAWLYSASGQQYCQYLYSKRYTKKKRSVKKTKRVMIPDRVGLDQRFLGATHRTRYGHFEGDTVVSRKGGQGGLSVLLERKSRLLVVKKLHNGQENRLHGKLGIKTFFCDPYSSWQKGGVENGNKMLRRYFPKGTDFRAVSQRQIDRAVQLINEKPRKILGYRSALEVARESGVVLKEANLCLTQVS